MSAAATNGAEKAKSGGSQSGKKNGTLRDFHEEERLGRAYDSQLLGRLWPFMRPHRKFLFASLCMLLVSAVFNLVRPLVMGRLIATAQSGSTDGFGLS